MRKNRTYNNVFRTKAIVLRYTNFKEADRMLTLFSPNAGKLQVMARGCRKPKSKLLSAVQLFAYGEYILKKWGDLYILTQADIIDSFYDIRNDIEKLTYAVYMLNLTEETVNFGEENRILFLLLLKVLAFMAYDDTDPQTITHVYEIKLSDLMGYRPQLDKCIICKENLTQQNYFDVHQGGLVCSKCDKHEKKGYTIQMGTVKAMRYILDMDLQKIKVLKFSEFIRQELNKIMPAYFNEKLEKSVKSRNMIEQLQRKN